jgi:hypothetical protein
MKSNYNYILPFLIVFVIFASGCLLPSNGITGNGLSITAEADPPTVFSGSTTNIYADIMNTDTKDLNNVMIGLYYTGMLTKASSCQNSQLR